MENDWFLILGTRGALLDLVHNAGGATKENDHILIGGPFRVAGFFGLLNYLHMTIDFLLHRTVTSNLSNLETSSICDQREYGLGL